MHDLLCGNYRIKQKGLALIQVLILASLLVVLGIAFTSIAQKQVKSAKALQDRASAFLMSYSAKNDVLFKLSTEEHSSLIGQGWKFYGSPFSLYEGVTIEVQDLNGLYSLPALVSEYELAVLLSHVADSRQSKVAAAAIVDWIDGDNTIRVGGAEQANYQNSVTVRNGPILTYSELLYIKGVTQEIADFMGRTTTFIPTPTFNPFSAPNEVLESLYPTNSGVSSAIRMRESEPNNIDGFQRALNIRSDEALSYIIGPNYKVRIKANVDGSYYGQEVDVMITPHTVFSIQTLHNRVLNR